MITNFLQPIEFQISVSRLPHVEFFTQRVNIPSVSANPAVMPTPFNPVHHTPDKLQYSPLDFNFIIDENMNNYIELFNWIKGTTFPERYTQFETLSKSKEGLYSDISILMLNSKKNPFIRVDFKNCQPISLSDIQLDTTSSDIVYPTAVATFSYTYFDLNTYKD